MSIPSDLIQKVLERADIVQIISRYLDVQKRGSLYLAICPFHNDSHPSLTISPEKRIFKCFACGTGGNAITFVQKIEGLSFEEAVKKVADLSGVSDERLNVNYQKQNKDPSLEPLEKCIADLALYYSYALGTEEGKAAREYLLLRGLNDYDIGRYEIGYAPFDGEKTIKFLIAKGHSLHSIEEIGVTILKSRGLSDKNAGRVIFPLHDQNGHVIGFSARKLQNDESPKYINSPETPLFHKSQVLYNYHRAKEIAHRVGYVYLLEGFMDVIALGKAGVDSAIALMGTSLSAEHLKMLRYLNTEIRLALDGDLAGQEGMIKALPALQKARLNVRVLSDLNETRDEDEILKEGGAEALKSHLNQLVNPFEFQLRYYLNYRKLETKQERERVISHFLPYISSLRPGIEKEDALIRLASATGYDKEAIRSLVEQKTFDKPSYNQVNLHELFASSSAKDVRKKEQKETRLYRSEKEILHYMFTERAALDFFLHHIDAFYDELLNELADYVIDYAEKRGLPVDIALLMSDIEMSENSSKEDLIALANDVAFDENEPPFALKNLLNCQRVINEEKEKIHDHGETSKLMKDRDPRVQAQAIEEYAKKKRQRLKNRKKEQGEKQ